VTTTDRGHAIRLRLPHARVEIRGEVPAVVADELSDLADQRLHLDPDAPTVSLHASRGEDRSWHVEPSAPDDLGIGPVAAGADDIDLLDALVGRLNRVAFHVDPARLHLHAAAVELDGAGILLAGASGSGKSTVTVELLRRGAAYLTDECVTVLPDSSTVFAYPKPITLKAGSLEWVALGGDHPVAGLEAAGNGRAHLRAGSVGDIAPRSSLGVIVLVRHTDEEPPTLNSISPAEACVRLLGDSLDGVRLGPSSLEVLARVVAGTSAWELVYRDAAEAAELIEQLRPPLRRRLVVTHRLTAGTGAAGVTGHVAANPYRSGDLSVRVARFDDSAALHDGGTRSLVVLDRDQIRELEAGTSGGPGLATLAEVLVAAPRPSPPSHAGDALAFGLPGRPIEALDDAPPLSAHDLELAAGGRCTGVLADQVARGRQCADPTLAQQIRDRHQAGQSTCALLERELPRLVDLLDASGVQPVVLKGPVSAHDGPLPPHFRDFGDLDLLIPAGQMSAAVATLSGAGFERCFPQVSAEFDRRFVKSVTLRSSFAGDWGERDTPTFELDLHRTLTPGPYGELVPLDELHDRAVPVRVHERWYRALHPTHRFLHHCLHVVLGSAEPRLHSLRDLVLSAPRSPVGVDEALVTARAWGVVAVVQRAVELADARFPGSLVPELVDGVRAARPRRIEHHYLASYHRPGRSYSLPALATLAALPSWRDRVDLATMLVRHRRSRRGE
jgi:hypothetical protein